MHDERKYSGSRPAKPEWKPNIEFFQSLSKDGRYVISQTVITSIKPRKYLETILGLHAPVQRSVDSNDRSS